ncbi:hypothetical protein SESBI_24666 [Sesbania bispinosa]|nr:hypothetical protein SESBI_24666 [Sesbania bispinosa]
MQVKDAPQELQDSPKQQKEKLEEIDVGEFEGEKRQLFINATLDKEEKERLVKLLKEFKDIFLEVCINLVTHNIVRCPEARPVK